MKRLLALVLCVALCLAMGMEGCRAGTICDLAIPYIWHKTKGNDLLVNFELENYFFGTIDSVDIAVYCTNAYGEVMHPDDGLGGDVRIFTCDITIKEGKSKKTGYCTLKGLKAAKRVYVAVYRCHFTNGSTLQFDDEAKSKWVDKFDYEWCDID